jgi:hypothetical protein
MEVAWSSVIMTHSSGLEAYKAFRPSLTLFCCAVSKIVTRNQGTNKIGLNDLT